MAKWRFYAYEVWGRGFDSWVNNVFKTDAVFDLPENPTDSEVIAAITAKIGDEVTIDHATSNEDTIYLTTPVTYTDEETGETMHDKEDYGELRRELEG